MKTIPLKFSSYLYQASLPCPWPSVLVPRAPSSLYPSLYLLLHWPDNILNFIRVDSLEWISTLEWITPLCVWGGVGGGDDGLSVCLRARNAAHVSIYLWLSWTWIETVVIQFFLHMTTWGRGCRWYGFQYFKFCRQRQDQHYEVW